MRVALFGGTFDPIHTAHLVVAAEARERFALDEVLFIPAANPPHKAGSLEETYEHRYRMVELACDAIPGFVPSRIEAGAGRSFSVLTIERLQRERSGDALFFLIGADAFSEIRTWFRWQDAIRLIEFLVVSRPGHQYDVPEGARVHRLETLALPVSSSGIREELAAGRRPAELPEAVWEYIIRNGLYGAGRMIE